MAKIKLFRPLNMHDICENNDDIVEADRVYIHGSLSVSLSSKSPLLYACIDSNNKLSYLSFHSTYDLVL